MSFLRLRRNPFRLCSSLLSLALCSAVASSCGDSDAGGGPPGDPHDASTEGGGAKGGSGGAAGSGGTRAGTGGSGGSIGGADAGRCSLLGEGALTFNFSARPGDDYVMAVAAAPDGHVYALHIDDNREAHVSRLEGNGAVQWNKGLFGQDSDAGSGYVNPAGLAADALGRVVVVGSFERTASFAGEVRSAAFAGNRTASALFALRLNADGTISYLKTIDGVDLSAAGVAIDGGNRAWIAGNVTVPTFFDPRTINLGGSDLTARGDDGFLLELEEDGSHRFSRTVGSPRARDHIVGIAIGPQGGPVIAGLMRGPSDLLGNDAGAESGIYVASFDAAGTLAWANFPQPRHYDSDKLTAIAATPSAVVVLGQYATSESPLDFGNGPLPPAEQGPPVSFVVRLGASGQELRARTFGRDPGIFQTDPYVSLTSAAIDAAGNVVVAANLDSTVDLGLGPIPNTSQSDFPLFLRFDASLNTVMSRAIGGCEFPGGYLRSSAVDPAGNFIVGGSLAGSADPSVGFGGTEPTGSVVFSIRP
jgi:hypothetical protein